VPLGPPRATLRTLAAILAGLSAAVWLVALAVGRRVCRRALAPVRRMAETAGEMTAVDLDQRLPASGSGDELDALAAAFNGLLDRLGESFDRQARFTGDASHQLRTPLTAILGQIEVASRRPRTAEEYERVLASVRGQAGHLRRIVESLLFLARSDGDARLPDLEHVDLGAWADQHVTALSGVPRSGEIRFERDGVGPLPAAVQPTLLGELVHNLLDNAAKYGPPGAPVVVRVRRHGGEVALSVTDSGTGISERDEPRLFTPFFRATDARHRGTTGVGLGLAIAGRIAKAFGGRIAFERPAAGGSRFTLFLPAADRDEVRHPEVVSAGTA
jgi:signal transduction histidine kinase